MVDAEALGQFALAQACRLAQGAQAFAALLGNFLAHVRKNILASKKSLHMSRILAKFGPCKSS